MPDTELANMALGAAIGAADLFYTEQSDVEKRVTGAMLAANTANYLSGLSTTTTLTDSNLIYVNQTTDKAITAANLRLDMQKNTRCIYARDYGAVFDGKMVKNVTITNTSAVISSTDYTFTSADEGKRFVIKLAENSTVYLLNADSTVMAGTIVSTSGGSATLSINMRTSTTTAVIYFGTDDTAAIQAAVNAGNPTDAALGASGTWRNTEYAAVILPAGMTLITAQIVVRPCVSIIGQGKFSTWVKWASPTSMATSGYYAAFAGVQANGSTRIYKDVQFRSFRIDMSAAYTTVYSYHAKCVEIVFTMRLCAIDMYFESSPATSFGCDYVAGGLVYGCTFENAGRLWSAGGGGGSGIDFQTDDGNMFISNFTLTGDPNSHIISGNIFINCAVSAIRNTNDNTSVRLARNVIANNLIYSNLSTGKGIEDSGNTGAIIVNNTLYHAGTAQSSEGPGGSEGQHFWGGILVTGGQRGIIANNAIHGGWYDGIRLMRFEKAGATNMPDYYLVTGNNVSGNTRNGLRLDIDSTYTATSITAAGNEFYLNGEAGVAVSNSGTGGTVEFLDLSNNRIYDNGATTATDALKSGIYINTTITGLNIVGGYYYDGGPATQKYGITVDTVAVTSAHLNAIKMNQNVTQAVNLTGGGTIAGEIYNNPGYNLGAATITPGASPYTYTAGATPEMVYIRGGTVSDIAKDSITIGTATGMQVMLRPNESVVVTYTVAPTMVKDRK